MLRLTLPLNASLCDQAARLAYRRDHMNVSARLVIAMQLACVVSRRTRVSLSSAIRLNRDGTTITCHYGMIP